MNKNLSIPDGSNLFAADNTKRYDPSEEPRGPERPFGKKDSGAKDAQGKRKD